MNRLLLFLLSALSLLSVGCSEEPNSASEPHSFDSLDEDADGPLEQAQSADGNVLDSGIIPDGMMVDSAGESEVVGANEDAGQGRDKIAPSQSIPLGEDSQLTLNGDGLLLSIERNGVVLLQIKMGHLLFGAVAEMDPELNYNPYRLTESAGGGRFKPEEISWIEATHFSEIQVTDSGITASLHLADGRQSQAEMMVYTDRLTFNWLPPTEGLPCPYRRLITTVDEEEGFYGLGGVLDHVNHRGLVRAMNAEVANLESGYNEVHVPVPLLTGTTGWGLFVESYRPGVFEVATEKSTQIQTTFGFANALEEGLLFHLFTAAHPLDLTRHYYDITGYPGSVAPWALGPWIWRDEVAGQEKVEEDLNTIRDLDLPTTGYWIDRPYATDVNSFDFDKAKYTDPEQMMTLAHELGFEVALWHTPYVDPDGTISGDLYLEAEAAGFFAPLLPTAFAKWGPPLDFSNPEAVEWWRGLLSVYKDLGITGYKLDFGEEVITGLFGKRLPARFADGTDEFTMHRRYSKLYHEAYRPMIPEDGGFLLCRAGSFGDQVNGCIIWPGDIDATMAKHGEIGIDKEGKEYISVGGLPAAIVAGSSLGPSGYPLFASDTGGYLHSSPTKECFVRWAEHTAFSPAMQVGTNTNDLPWEFGPDRIFDEELVSLYRVLAQAHLRLHPYLWTEWKAIQKTGRAIQRPLGLAHPELGIHPDDIYLLGPDILVAPIVDKGTDSREVTLPEGNWVHWWTGETSEGSSSFEVSSPLGQPPVWFKEGVPIPLLRPSIESYQSTATPELVDSFVDNPNPLHIRVTTGAEAERTLYDDTWVRQATGESGISLSWVAGDVFTDGIVFELWGLSEAPSLVTLEDGTTIEASEEPSSNTWIFENGVLTISLSGGGQSLTVTPAP